MTITINPLTRVGSALLLAAALIWSIDPVSAGVALGLELALFPLLRIPARAFWTRTAVIWIAAPLAGLTLLLYGRPSGHIWFHWLFIEISDGSIELAISNALRVLAIALPAVVLLIGVDPTELADALAQRLRLPARFVLGALGALRLVGLLRQDAQMLAFARRARGVADRGRLRRFAGLAFALLVLAVRRGTQLATAMEARGFGAPGTRSWARRSRFGRGDAVLGVVAVLVAAATIASAAVTGSWRFIGG